MAENTNGAEEPTASRPMNVEQIVQKAQSYDYNPLIPLKYWLRTAGTLLKEVYSLHCHIYKQSTDVDM